MRIYEHGIATNGDQVPPIGLREVATDELPVFSQSSLVLIDDRGDSLNARLAVVLDPAHAHTNADYYEEKDARYALRSCAYHVERLVTMYNDHQRSFESTERLRAIERGHQAVSGAHDEERIYFEIDAFFAAARRFWEEVRKVLWKHFGGTSGRPRNIEKVLGSPGLNLPSSIDSSVRSRWEDHGTRVKQYRDSAFHNVPLTRGHTNILLMKFDGRWGVRVALPANPEAKSRRLFDFDSGPDALSYCHGVLCDLVDLAGIIGDATGLEVRAPEASAMRHPPSGSERE